MNTFQTAINDIFNVDDFIESCIINNIQYNCVQSSMNSTVMYSDTGRSDEANFTLDIKLPIESKINVNDRVAYRNTKWKVSRIEIDASNTTIKLYLIDLSKSI